MNRQYLDYRHPDVRELLAHTYPEYNGQKVRMEQQEFYTPQNYWSEGSRTYYRLVRLSDYAVLPEAPTNNPFTDGRRGAKTFPIPDGAAVVEHVIFLGKDLGIVVLVNANTAPTLLPDPTTPAPPSLHPFEETWLDCLAGLTSAGRKDAIERYRLPQKAVDRAIARLVQLSYATKNKAGAVGITIAGRQRRSDRVGVVWDLYRMDRQGEHREELREYAAR